MGVYRCGASGNAVAVLGCSSSRFILWCELCGLHVCLSKLVLATFDALCRAVHDLSATTSQKQAQILLLAKQSAEQGIGDNDLKRLKRQFDSNKATYVNVDQKQRFMRGEQLVLHLHAC